MPGVHNNKYNAGYEFRFFMGKPITIIAEFAGFILSFSVIFVLLLFSHWLYAAPPAELPRVIPSSYIVVFHDDVDTDVAANELKGRFNLNVGFRYRHALRGMAVKMPEQVLAKLAADPRVAYIEPDVMVSINTQTLPTGINRVNADLDPIANIDNIDDRVDADIAILDTGIDLDHPDLNVFQFAYCQAANPPATRFECVEGDARAEDGNSHGTHVSGTAAALDNNSGVVGVAPGARLWAVKVLDDNGEGAGSVIIAGVDYVKKHADKIEVANMSLTGEGSFTSLDKAINSAINAGVVFTLAAGNDSTDVANVFPAGNPSAITVSALEDYDGKPGGVSGNAQDDTFASFSNFGSGVDIMAPGRNISSTKPGGGLGTKSGTSMAAPHVAGAAALYLSQNPGASPATVKTALLAAGDPTPCANSADWTCADDPDGIQEPLLLLAYDDTDGDGIPDNVDTDDDDDGLLDVDEVTAGTNPFVADTDGDGFDDGMEVSYGSDPLLIGDTPAGNYNNNGDINDDDKVDAADVLLATRMVLGQLTPTSEQLIRADMVPDGQINAGDLVRIQQLALGL
jgi:subtilisin family serine protease